MSYKSTEANHYRGKMGQDHSLKLTDEEKKELSVGLLRSWWLEATQALVDVVGNEEALGLLKPYFQHSGMAGRRVYYSITNLDLNGRDSANASGYALTTFLGGRFTPAYLADDGSGIGELYDCATSGICKEACTSFCQFGALSYMKEMSPDWEIRLTRSLSWGDSFCQWRTWRSETSAKVQAIEEMRIPLDKVFRDPLDDATRKYLGLAYAGEAWVMATRAILDSPGLKEGMDDLHHRMRLYGLSMGLRARGWMPKDSRAIAIYDVVQLISELHQRKSEIVLEDEGAAGTVKECPFAGSAPPETCLQYESFFNGICEAIDPSYEFAYDRMMTKGDKTCHWTIRKKGAAKEKPQGEAAKEPGETAFELLKKRLVKGEITPEQYRQLRDIMLEK
jgi:hypothetical protein